MLIANAFSLGMLMSLTSTIKVVEITLEQARELASAGLESIVGHANTADVFSEQLQVPVPMNRCSVSLDKGNQLLVGQYKGPRLPEGTTSLPEGSSISWCTLTVE
ncbi:DUF1874 domain-containing protein [Candidatus Uhrbacteria bacterium]|jgi:hypothetical protein|nr:DUF1874 domain-containing protein [Candidatus Uhrbacteria bacterium]